MLLWVLKPITIPENAFHYFLFWGTWAFFPLCCDLEPEDDCFGAWQLKLLTRPTSITSSIISLHKLLRINFSNSSSFSISSNSESTNATFLSSFSKIKGFSVSFKSSTDLLISELLFPNEIPIEFKLSKTLSNCNYIGKNEIKSEETAWLPPLRSALSLSALSCVCSSEVPALLLLPATGVGEASGIAASFFFARDSIVSHNFQSRRNPL